MSFYTFKKSLGFSIYLAVPNPTCFSLPSPSEALELVFMRGGVKAKQEQTRKQNMLFLAVVDQFQ